MKHCYTDNMNCVSLRRIALAVAVALLGVFGGGCGPADLRALAPGASAELFNGRDLSGGEVLTDDYFDAPGKVYVADGTIVLEAGDDLTGVRWTGRMLRDNFCISLRARRVAGEDFFCGLTFPVREGHVSLILGGWGGMVVGLSNVDHMAAVENNTTQIIEFKLKRWYDVDVSVGGGHIRVYLDGKEIIDQAIDGHQFVVWPEMEPSRPLGIATYRTKGQIRDICVERLGG